MGDALNPLVSTASACSMIKGRVVRTGEAPGILSVANRPEQEHQSYKLQADAAIGIVCALGLQPLDTDCTFHRSTEFERAAGAICVSEKVFVARHCVAV